MLRILILLVLVVAMAESTRILTAANLTEIAQNRYVGGASSATQRHSIEAQVLKARSIHPGMSASQVLLAELATTSSLRVDRYRELTEIQPADARHWADLFASLVADQRVGFFVNNALNTALALGPWDPYVLEVALDAGTRHWLLLDEPARYQIVLAYRRTVNNPLAWRRSSRMQLVTQRGFQELFTRSLNADIAPRP